MRRSARQASTRPACFISANRCCCRTIAGRASGTLFFDQREAHARALGRFALTAFCSVQRDPHDTRRPADYRPNDAFWRKRGYAPQPGMQVRLEWAELQHGEIDHSLEVWTRALQA